MVLVMVNAGARRPSGMVFLWLAAAAGGLHTAFSVYWAFGGMWLLETVGQSAVDLQRSNRPLAVLILTLASAVKGAGAALPLLIEYRGSPWMRRLIRAVSWVGGVGLLCYGTAITVVATAVLSGAIAAPANVDRTGLAGHATLWNPLFALWGAFLLAGLWLTRRPLDANGSPQTPTVLDERPTHSDSSK